jgi:transposase
MDGTAQSSGKPETVKPKRRQWSEEERQRIVQASLKAGTTVDAIARLYGVHASQIYDWRKQHRQKLQAGKRSALLPVQVAKGAPLVVSETKQECSVVIEARNVRVAVSGYVDAVIIRTLVECLAR